MEKQKAHYPLARVRECVRTDRYRITATAIKTAFEDFGILPDQMAEHILGLEESDFYKSMTSRHDPALWQDVYHRAIGRGTAYIKLQIQDDGTVIISFKEK